MKPTRCIKLLALSLALLWMPSIARGIERPNILLILADDLGWSDLGAYGGEIHTPNLDALAKNGLRFTQFYNSARCCPTRASLITGLYPQQAGVGSMTGDRGPDHPGYRGTLQPHAVTLAEVLRDAGYRTFMAGKWHLHNKAADVKPTDRGFDDFYGMLGGFNSCWQENPYYTRWPNGRPVRAYTSAAEGPAKWLPYGNLGLNAVTSKDRKRSPYYEKNLLWLPHGIDVKGCSWGSGRVCGG